MTAATVHQFDAGMTEAAYRAEREQIRATYGDGSSTQARAASDQALAALFVRSGWTQERLAEVEKKSRKWIEYHVRFGAFLDFGTTVPNPELDVVRARLTERAFRGYWAQTQDTGNDRQRFLAVQKALRADLHISKSTAPKPKALALAIKQLADGVWHREATIAAHAQKACAALDPPIAVTEQDVHAVLYHMVVKGTHGVRCEKKKGAKGWSYRLVRAGRTVKADAFLSEIRPIVEALKAEGRKNMATMSPWTVAQLADRLEKLLETMVAGTSEPALAGSAPEDDSHG
jgi:hypothetical protein